MPVLQFLKQVLHRRSQFARSHRLVLLLIAPSSTILEHSGALHSSLSPVDAELRRAMESLRPCGSEIAVHYCSVALELKHHDSIGILERKLDSPVLAFAATFLICLGHRAANLRYCT
jgi:hypothetical protein